DGAERDADDEREQHGGRADPERDACAVHDAREHVTAERVLAERMGGRRGPKPLAERGRVRVEGEGARSDGGAERQEGEETEAGRDGRSPPVTIHAGTSGR